VRLLLPCRGCERYRIARIEPAASFRTCPECGNAVPVWRRPPALPALPIGARCYYVGDEELQEGVAVEFDGTDRLRMRLWTRQDLRLGEYPVSQEHLMALHLFPQKERKP
jgi:hypothetical protein